MTLRLMLFAVLVTFLFGCPADPPANTSSSCTTNADCPAGNYCGDADTCTQDCDASAPDPGCDVGFTCDPIGRCVPSGECADDSDCDSPPTSGSCDGDTLVSSSESGTCTLIDGDGSCSYSETRTECENGCENGACIGTCDPATCVTPPNPTCDGDGQTQITYETQGFCDTGICTYTEVPVSCAAGCNNGECLAGGCDATPCTTPPDDRCNGQTILNYGDSGTCEEIEGRPVCDYDLAFFHCGYVGGTCNNAMCENPITQVGGVVITEYHSNPVSSFNDLEEWFEIVNTSGADIDLNGWIIRSNSTGGNIDEHTIGANGEVVPAFPDGGRLLFARTGPANVNVDYDYSGITLANNFDWLRIINTNGDIADHVFYESGTIMAGRSRKLNPNVPITETDNDDFSNWCPSLTDEYGAGNFGTPGAENTPCDADPCADWTCVKPDDFCNDNTAVAYQGNSATCEATRFNNPLCDYQTVATDCTDGVELCAFGACETIPANTPKAAGDLVISEIMANPSGTDTDREWIEVHNPTGADISLFSVFFEDGEQGSGLASFQILDANAVVPAGGYAVLARNADPAVNGGLPANTYDYNGTHLKNTNYDNDDADPNDDIRLQLFTYDRVLLDEAYYSNLETPGAGMKSGISNQLNQSNLVHTDNDSADNWCEGQTSYGDGGLGTPGAANDCP